LPRGNRRGILWGDTPASCYLHLRRARTCAPNQLRPRLRRWLKISGEKSLPQPALPPASSLRSGESRLATRCRTSSATTTLPLAAAERVNLPKNFHTRWAVHERFVTGLSAGPRPLFVPGRKPVDRRLIDSVNPSHARHVREFIVTAKLFTAFAVFADFAALVGLTMIAAFTEPQRS